MNRMSYRLLLLLVLSFSSFSFSKQGCRQIHVVSYTTKQGKIDPFGLTGLVENYFQQQGFEVLAAPSNVVKSDCQYYQCALSHTENYWKFKRDSVCLTITDQLGKSIGRYCGVSGKTALSFQSGYATAASNALSNIRQSPFY